MRTKRINDSLRYAEAWSYLQDVLFLILSHQLPEEDEALALLVCPIISLGLMRILQLSSVCCEWYHARLFLTHLICRSRLHTIVTLDYELALGIDVLDESWKSSNCTLFHDSASKTE